MVVERYFFHSFCRPRAGVECIDKGMKILRSITTHGILTAPERYTIQEHLEDGRLGEPVEVFQKRVCFTELHPRELKQHRRYFGSYAIEWEIEKLMQLGVSPVFYMPQYAINGEHSPLGATLMTRLSELQVLLKRLIDLEEECNKVDPSELIAITRGSQRLGTTRATFGAAQDVLKFLGARIQSFDQLHNMLKFIAGYFYSTENPAYHDELLSYYRQREWRMLSNLVDRGNRISRELTDGEKAELIDIDDDFFSQVIQFRQGPGRLVDQCSFLYSGRRIIESAHRIIVPDETYDEATSLVGKAGPKVIPISEYDALYQA